MTGNSKYNQKLVSADGESVDESSVMVTVTSLLDRLKDGRMISKKLKKNFGKKKKEFVGI